LINDHERDSRYQAIRSQLENTTKKVPSALKGLFFKTIPDVMNAECEFHGKYEFQKGKDEEGKVIDFNGMTPIYSICPECSLERQESIDDAAFEKYKRDTQNRITDKLERSGVSPRNMDKTFDSYIADTREKKKALSTAIEYASCVCRFEKPFNLIMVGTTGTGKTHLAHAITHLCILAGRTCATIQLKDLIAEYRASWRDQTAPSDREIIKKYGTMDALAIDEMGLSEMSENESVILFEVLSERYDNKLSTVLITNLEIGDFKKDILGDRVSDRIREDGVRAIAMAWESERGKA
jgi:DNA replication protein DnaC